MRTNRYGWLLAGIAATGWVAGNLAGAEPRQTGKEESTMKLTSVAFTEGRPIPANHTCDGADASPPLHWSEAPAGTRSFALICDDPDAPVGTWVHWVIYGLPATAVELPAMVAPTESLPNGAKQGLNDFRRVGYGGPCPPPGGPHRYFFKLYALDEVLGLGEGIDKEALEKAMELHILGKAQLIGLYKRGKK